MLDSIFDCTCFGVIIAIKHLAIMIRHMFALFFTLFIKLIFECIWK